MLLNSMCNNFTNKILGIYLTYSILTEKPTLPGLVLFALVEQNSLKCLYILTSNFSPLSFSLRFAPTESTHEADQWPHIANEMI